MPAPPPDFRALFEAAPGACLVLAPDPPRFTIVAVTEDYLLVTRTIREAILGRGLFEIGPADSTHPGATWAQNLRASLERVMRDGAADTMAVQRHDIRRPEVEGGGYEERYWSPRNWPVPDPQGGVAHIVHQVSDVTELVRPEEEGLEQGRLTEAIRTRTGEMQVELDRRSQELAEANRRLRDVNQRADQLDQVKTELLANVSHELRTPLTLILGTLERLLHEPDSPPRDVPRWRSCSATRASSSSTSTICSISPSSRPARWCSSTSPATSHGWSGSTPARSSRRRRSAVSSYGSRRAAGCGPRSTPASSSASCTTCSRTRSSSPRLAGACESRCARTPRATGS